jgi:hypothetical protein
MSINKPARRGILALAAIAMWSLSYYQDALAWGASGHRMISRLAVENLPTDVPAFLRTAKVAALLGEMAREPDRSKGTGNSHDRDLDPGHYINLSDNFAVADEVPIDPLPATREEYDSALRTKGTNQYKVGFLPYAIVDGWQQLQRDFAYWRANVAAESSAKSRADRAWFAKDRRLREIIILRDLGYWSHFVADGSQPMHTSIHRDGWGDYPNPQGYSTTRGFHAAFEGAFVVRHIRPSDITDRMRRRRDCGCSIQSDTVAYLRETHSQLVPLFELEKSGAFSVNSAAGLDFTADRLAAAASKLRDMIVSAWRTSVDSTVGHPSVLVREIESRRINPIDQMRGLD